jgi:hypothetical protein
MEHWLPLNHLQRHLKITKSDAKSDAHLMKRSVHVIRYRKGINSSRPEEKASTATSLSIRAVQSQQSAAMLHQPTISLWNEGKPMVRKTSGRHQEDINSPAGRLAGMSDWLAGRL